MLKQTEESHHSAAVLSSGGENHAMSRSSQKLSQPHQLYWILVIRPVEWKPPIFVSSLPCWWIWSTSWHLEAPFIMHFGNPVEKWKNQSNDAFKSEEICYVFLPLFWDPCQTLFWWQTEGCGHVTLWKPLDLRNNAAFQTSFSTSQRSTEHLVEKLQHCNEEPSRAINNGWTQREK